MTGVLEQTTVAAMALQQRSELSALLLECHEMRRKKDQARLDLLACHSIFQSRSEK